MTSILVRIRSSQQYSTDLLVVILLTFSVLANTFLAVKYATTDIYVSVVNIVFICLSLLGLMLHQVFCGGVKYAPTIPTFQSQIIISFVAVGFFLVLIAQTVVFQFTSGSIVLATFLENKIFYITAGVSEELFFRYYIQTKIEQSLPVLKPLCIPVASFLFYVYHIPVYGSNVYALYAVFVSSVVLGSVYYLSKRISVPMIIHVLVNLVAS